MTPDETQDNSIEFLESQVLKFDDSVAEYNPEAGVSDDFTSDADPGDVEYLNGIENLIIVDGAEQVPADPDQS